MGSTGTVIGMHIGVQNGPTGTVIGVHVGMQNGAYWRQNCTSCAEWG